MIQDTRYKIQNTLLIPYKHAVYIGCIINKAVTR